MCAFLQLDMRVKKLGMYGEGCQGPIESRIPLNLCGSSDLTSTGQIVGIVGVSYAGRVTALRFCYAGDP